MSNAAPTNDRPHPPINDAGDGQVIPETRVKQGRQGYPVLAVLVVSTILAAVVLFGIWSLHAGKLSDAGAASKASRAAASQTYNAPAPAPKMTPGDGSAPAAPDH